MFNWINNYELFYLFLGEQCGSLNAVEHSDLTEGRTIGFYGDDINVSCNSGYVREDDENDEGFYIVCIRSGEWWSGTETCIGKCFILCLWHTH